MAAIVQPTPHRRPGACRPSPPRPPVRGPGRRGRRQQGGRGRAALALAAIAAGAALAVVAAGAVARLGPGVPPSTDVAVRRGGEALMGAEPGEERGLVPGGPERSSALRSRGSLRSRGYLRSRGSLRSRGYLRSRGSLRSRGYIVRPGDTLWEIARSIQPRGDVRPLVDRLAKMQGRAGLRAGERIILPDLSGSRPP